MNCDELVACNKFNSATNLCEKWDVSYEQETVIIARFRVQYG